MFGTQFYPTPTAIIEKMVSGLKLDHKRILDPSAGRGDILDFVKDLTRYSRSSYDRSHSAELYAIEIDPDLRQVLTGKGYRVIDSDFLSYNGVMYFDVILMNPPFSDGVSHLLKAWEVSNGAIIKCLLNTESLRNTYTEERRILKNLIATYGDVIDLGRPFTRADNPTDVEVSLVTLQDTRPRESFRLDFDPARMGQNGYHLGDLEENQLAPADVFENYEARYNAAITAFKDLLETRQRVSYYLKGLIPDEHRTPESIISEAVNKPGSDIAYSSFLDDVTRLAWDNLFRKTKLSNVTTESVRGEIEKMQAAQGTMSFTVDNMRDLFEMLFLNREHIMVKCVLEAFDMLTKHHPENRLEIEGWKTNSAYRVGKFILPRVGSDFLSGLDYSSTRDLYDLERALCFLSGKKFENILHIADVYNHKSHFGQWMASEFFETQLYKRRTMHFKWLDQDLCDRFNALVAQHRWGWIPEKAKRGVYR